jgi:glycosyltransferase involved in cell wall biosynthesis
MPSPLITALIDTYNHEKYIEQALVSVLEQGLSAEELEIVAVDDGSTDRTPEIIKKFAPRVKHLRKENGGQASAFNAGFAEAHGEIIAILDGDDWWAKGKLAACVEALERNPEVAAVGHGFHKFDDETKTIESCVPPKSTVINLATPQAAREASLLWTFLLMGALTLRRKVLDQIMPLPNDMLFMADTVIQTAAMNFGVLLLQEQLFYYRQHGGNLWAVDPANAARLCRRYDMTDIAYRHASRILKRLNVPDRCILALLGPNWFDANRARLLTFGGSPLKTFRTEMLAFRMGNENPSAAYLFYKYAIMGAATLLLPPKQFYKLHDWYAKRRLGRYRDLLFKAGGTPTLPEKPSERT